MVKSPSQFHCAKSVPLCKGCTDIKYFISMFSDVFIVCVCFKSLYFAVRYTKDGEGRVKDSEFYSAVYTFN